MFTLNCKGRLLLIDKPIVMGIINVTPDSFFEGSRFTGTDRILAQAELQLQQGATMLDIGGQSTRPGSERISADEELSRVIKPVELLHKMFPEAFISIDTYSAKVATAAVAAGACLVNDISGGSLDDSLVPAVAASGVPYVLMHMKGTPELMQEKPMQENVTGEVLDFMVARKKTMEKAGIRDFIIDPGFGFGKSRAANFELLQNLSLFSVLDAPLLAGLSRKSFIYKTLGGTPADALNGTTALHTIALLNGASIVRAHDVKEAMEVIRLVDAYRQVAP